ncbi:hypothetical protein C0995_016136 [Termitomyces sp. Mi166|nr:hypothetical protein C0995_016136 [Termitomyces sp. Mi166\
MTSNPILTITARYIWELIFDYDNRGNPGKITHTDEFVRSGSYTSTTFNETVSSEAKKLAESGSTQFQSGVSYGPITASVRVGYATSNEINTMLENTTKKQSEQMISWSVQESHEYTVGPHSRLILYQRNFYGPGIRVQGSALRTTSVPLPSDEMEEEVLIDLELVPKMFISGMRVVYTDKASDAPGDRVRDWFGGSDNINYSFSGKHVWLVPEWTNRISQALTNFDLVVQSQDDVQYSNLARGAGGDYRYLIPVRQSNQKLFISQLTLARSVKALDDLHNTIWRGLPQGATGDINKGRRGDFLYLVWELERTYEV